MKRQTYYYSDPLTDDFAGTNIKTKNITKDYAYFPKNPFRKIWRVFFYRVIAIPTVFIMQRFCFREKYVGREKLKPYKKDGFFMYGNHTRLMGDAYCPQLICHFKILRRRKPGRGFHTFRKVYRRRFRGFSFAVGFGY